MYTIIMFYTKWYSGGDLPGFSCSTNELFVCALIWFLSFVSSCNTQEVFDWWSKYDASRDEEAKTAKEKVVIRRTVIPKWFDFVRISGSEMYLFHSYNRKECCLYGTKESLKILRHTLTNIWPEDMTPLKYVLFKFLLDGLIKSFCVYGFLQSRIFFTIEVFQ